MDCLIDWLIDQVVSESLARILLNSSNLLRIALNWLIDLLIDWLIDWSGCIGEFGKYSPELQ